MNTQPYTREENYSFVGFASARNLRLLQDIEATLKSLASDTRHFHAITETYEDVLLRLEKHNTDTLIDPKGEVEAALTLAIDACGRIHARAIKQHEAACKDPLLTDEDGVADAYMDYLNAVDAAQEAAAALKDWLTTHEAVQEPSKPGVYRSAEELFEAIGV